MSIFNKIFGKNTAADVPQKSEATRNTNDHRQAKLSAIFNETLQEYKISVYDILKIIRHYDVTLENISRESDRNICPIILYPESVLSLSTNFINSVMHIAKDTMDKWEMDDYFGLSRNDLLGHNYSLHFHFAPDEEIPKNQFDNMYVWAKRVREQYPKQVLDNVNSFRTNQEFYRVTADGAPQMVVSNYIACRKQNCAEYLAFTWLLSAWYLCQRESLL